MPRSPVPDPAPGFAKLSPEERVDCVQPPGERAVVPPDSLPTLDWHLEIVRERLEIIEASCDPDRTRSDIRVAIEEKLEQRRARATLR